MKKVKVVRTIGINLFQKQADIVARIEEDEELSGRIRELINKYGEERWPEDPAYAKAMKMRAEAKEKEAKEAKELEEMTPENYCTNVLGGVVRGDSCAFIMPNSNLWKVDLADIKNTPKDASIVKLHNSIKNYTYVSPLNGEKWTKEQCDAVLAYLDK